VHCEDVASTLDRRIELDTPPNVRKLVWVHVFAKQQTLRLRHENLGRIS
jgi:hypothetical protein